MRKRMTQFRLGFLLSAILCLQLFQPAAAAEKVVLANPGWTDLSSTDGVAITLLNALGYQAEEKTISGPIAFAAIRKGDVDIFLGNWLPAQKSYMKPAGEFEIVGHNLDGAKFTLAVPHYAYEAGVKTFADLNKFADKFHHRIYGIEPGSASNVKIQKMIDSNAFNLGDWKLVESSEQGEMSQLKRATRRERFIVFQGWEPHPMNTNFDIDYLSGGDEIFGPNFGGAYVQTLVRNGLKEDQPNVYQLAKNLKFTLDMENEMMGFVLNDQLSGAEAASKWIKAHPDVLKPWLEGVTTIDGQPGLPAVKKALGIN